MDKRHIMWIAVIVGVIALFVIISTVTLDNNKETNEIYSSNSTTMTNEEETQTNNKEEENMLTTNEDEEISNNIYSTGKHNVAIEIEGYGTIEVELDADVAPITVANFTKLVNEGFYDGLTFHRIIDGFMIQGGDPEGNGTGGSSENITGEFSLNGIENSISHVRGTISMARSSEYDSASSQFFIVHEDSTFLDGQYAGFGKVTSGIEIVDEICEDTQVEDDNGTVLEENQPIIKQITILN